MTKTYNFSAGPAVLPQEVLEKAQSEFLNYQESGMSVMEMSHRSSIFENILEDAKTALRQLMGIPENYHLLFLQGGASLQFTMVPLNLTQNQTAYYVDTGSWSKKAISEAKKIPHVTVSKLASSEDKNFSYIPEIDENSVPSTAAYVHITTNNTIEGTSFQTLPHFKDVPLVADMSSNILSNDYDINDFGLIYAGAQKNIGPAGLTLVIIRDDLLKDHINISNMLDYRIHVKNNSLYNTPNTFGIYMAKLGFEWLLAKGGIPEIVKENKEKSGLLYDFIDHSKLFTSPVAQKDRSINNIPFLTGNKELDSKFVSEAEALGLVNIKGHRSVGGMRASLYNAFPMEGVEKLVNFMETFEKEHGGK
ncbi:3-phosphoserine/phosphohydroxythreonine transaminase [Vagococcus elongatus]|uniref:Phosphoserine aminotransferase n=1 Tax=Vagococcus elongatus TaxID=180344 RepID=A0A430AU86_9ENTE|nr:3-phosphoserine/phosphohydroxythreonine transaminase [Vagococcus elongatus]RSU11613.1 phosphoserine transaminase [Vagococcus elongatus]